MIPSEFTIIGASAGSGKTFAVTKAYLKRILTTDHKDAFKHILAITFTNKAVGEMKTRIIETLKSFAAYKDGEAKDPMMTLIAEETQLTPSLIQSKSEELLKHILHNYGGFEVSTIDSFIHRIIRTFAMDLNIPQNFEVELEQEDMLAKAVDTLISETKSNDDLSSVLVAFALEKSDEDKSHDISYDLKTISKLLISENDAPHLQTLQHKTLDDFKNWQTSLQQNLTTLNKQLNTSAENFYALLREHQLEGGDLIGGIHTFFKNILKEKFPEKFDAKWQTTLETDGTIYPKKLLVEKHGIVEQIQPKIKDYYLCSKKLIIELWMVKAIYKNLVPLSILSALQAVLTRLKTEEQKVLISEFNSLIKTEIKDQPTPYIFERLGEKFKHYFIDEFQDTSILQWQNLIPLIDHSLSTEENSATLVGDVKQAIYRWRGGDASQFSDLILGRSQPFQLNANTQQLDSNYRSSSTIVEFNNAFFEFIAEQVFNDDNHKAHYKKAGQQIKTNSEGYIELQFQNSENKEEQHQDYAKATISIIKDCLSRNFNLSDICVLVRNKKDGVALAKALGEADIAISSSEALLLKNSWKVNFLRQLLELLVNPNDQLLKAQWLYDLGTLRNVENVHAFINNYIDQALTKTIQELYNTSSKQIAEPQDNLPLYDLMAYYVQLFKFNEHSDAYVQFYLDVILEYSQKYQGHISGFIDYFNEHEDKLSISAPEDLNAVSIMTIHKSKGLEFPVVILPYADLSIYDDRKSHLWAPIDPSSHEGFSTAMLNVNKKLELFPDSISSLYKNHRNQLELDHINLLYVALTRPKQELYIICQNDHKEHKANLNTFAGLFVGFLQQQYDWSPEELIYKFGTKTTLKEKALSQNTVLALPNDSDIPNQALSLVTQSGLLWDTEQEKAIASGNLIHQLLALITTKDDIPKALELMLVQGKISQDEQSYYQTLVEHIVNHPQLSTYFSHLVEVHNERDIIIPNETTQRPDRLCISKDQTAIIIDYKTGAPQPSHIPQVNRYKSLLNQMLFTKTKGLLIYINDDIKVIEV